MKGLVPPFLGPGFRLGARWNRLVETVKMRKKREKTGNKWARYGLRSVNKKGEEGCTCATSSARQPNGRESSAPGTGRLRKWNGLRARTGEHIAVVVVRRHAKPTVGPADNLRTRNGLRQPVLPRWRKGERQRARTCMVAASEMRCCSSPPAHRHHQHLRGAGSRTNS